MEDSLLSVRAGERTCNNNIIVMNLFRLSVTDGFSEKTERMVCYFSGFVPSVVVCSLAVKAISMLRVSFFFVELLFFFSIHSLHKTFSFFLGADNGWLPGSDPLPTQQKIVEPVWQHRWSTANAMMCVSFWVSSRSHVDVCVMCSVSCISLL